MKYLVLFGVLLVVYLLWRAQRRSERDEAPKRPPAAPALPQDMVRCPVCSVHLPRTDALPGTGERFFCSPEHRLIGEG